MKYVLCFLVSELNNAFRVFGTRPFDAYRQNFYTLRLYSKNYSGVTSPIV